MQIPKVPMSGSLVFGLVVALLLGMLIQSPVADAKVRELDFRGDRADVAVGEAFSLVDSRRCGGADCTGTFLQIWGLDATGTFTLLPGQTEKVLPEAASVRADFADGLADAGVYVFVSVYTRNDRVRGVRPMYVFVDDAAAHGSLAQGRLVSGDRIDGTGETVVVVGRQPFHFENSVLCPEGSSRQCRINEEYGVEIYQIAGAGQAALVNARGKDYEAGTITPLTRQRLRMESDEDRFAKTTVRNFPRGIGTRGTYFFVSVSRHGLDRLPKAHFTTLVVVRGIA